VSGRPLIVAMLLAGCVEQGPQILDARLEGPATIQGYMAERVYPSTGIRDTLLVCPVAMRLRTNMPVAVDSGLVVRKREATNGLLIGVIHRFRPDEMEELWGGAEMMRDGHTVETTVSALDSQAQFSHELHLEFRFTVSTGVQRFFVDYRTQCLPGEHR